MSDFQDEQGLGELPDDLSAQSLRSYVLPSSPTSDLTTPQNQTGVLGMNIPQNKTGAMQFIFESRPLFCEDFIFIAGLNLGSYNVESMSYTVPNSKILIIREYEYVAVDVNGLPIQPTLFSISLNGVGYQNLSAAGIRNFSAQDKKKCFIVVDSGATVSFNFSASATNRINFSMTGNLMQSNGEIGYLQAAGI